VLRPQPPPAPLRNSEPTAGRPGLAFRWRPELTRFHQLECWPAPTVLAHQCRHSQRDSQVVINVVGTSHTSSAGTTVRCAHARTVEPNVRRSTPADRLARARHPPRITHGTGLQSVGALDVHPPSPAVRTSIGTAPSIGGGHQTVPALEIRLARRSLRRACVGSLSFTNETKRASGHCDASTQTPNAG